MGSWNETSVGMKVKEEYKKIAHQFLVCLGVNIGECIIEEVGRLSPKFAPEIEGSLGTYISYIEYPFMKSLEDHFVNYQDKFYGFGPDDEYSEDDESSLFQIDDIYYLANALFAPAHLFLAHEEGNNTSDSYYRYEVIFDPSSGKKTELNCYYCKGEGINVGGDNPRKDGTEKEECKIPKSELSDLLIDHLIKKAEMKGADELLEKLQSIKRGE